MLVAVKDLPPGSYRLIFMAKDAAGGKAPSRVWTSISPTRQITARTAPNVAAGLSCDSFLFHGPAQHCRCKTVVPSGPIFSFPSRACRMVGPRGILSSSARAPKGLHSNALWSCPSEPAFLPSLFRRLYYICTSSLQLISPPRVILWVWRECCSV